MATAIASLPLQMNDVVMPRVVTSLYWMDLSTPGVFENAIVKGLVIFSPMSLSINVGKNLGQTRLSK